MVEEPRLTVEEIVEQASGYVLVATNGGSVMGAIESIDMTPLDILHLAYNLRQGANDLEARVFK